MLSQKTRYTIRALQHLADNCRQGPVRLDAIAGAQNIPRKFLTVILSEMVREGLVISHRGREGGYELALSPVDVRYGDIIRLTRGSLALIILIDQFSRNLYRGSSEAFAKDDVARELTLTGLANGFYDQLGPFEQMFFVLPLGHSEVLEHQDRAVALCETWVATLPAALKGLGEGALQHSRQHRDVIARFGRFPTRNAALGRVSTPGELAYLAEIGDRMF